MNKTTLIAKLSGPLVALGLLFAASAAEARPAKRSAIEKRMKAKHKTKLIRTKRHRHFGKRVYVQRPPLRRVPMAKVHRHPKFRVFKHIARKRMRRRARFMKRRRMMMRHRRLSPKIDRVIHGMSRRY